MGEITVDNLANRWVSFAGNATALFMGGFLSIGISLIWPDNFDWDSIRNRTILSDKTEPYSNSSKEVENETIIEIKNGEDFYKTEGTSVKSLDLDIPQVEDIPLSKLNRQFRVFTILSLSFAFVFAIVIPAPQIAAPYVYGKKFFTFVVSVNIIWLFGTFAVCVILPIVESRKFLKKLFLNIVGARKDEINDDSVEERSST